LVQSAASSRAPPYSEGETDAQKQDRRRARTDEGLMDHAKLLSQKGLRVCVMQGGLLAWEAARLPIVKTALTRTID
jgi:hypothetical protein